MQPFLIRHPRRVAGFFLPFLPFFGELLLTEIVILVFMYAIVEKLFKN
jgi:hypothetical protein